MCGSVANQEGARALVVLFAESLIGHVRNRGLEGLEHIEPKLEAIVRLQKEAMLLFEKSSSIITEIDGIVSGEAGERNPTARKRRGRSQSSGRSCWTPTSCCSRCHDRSIAST